MSKRNNCPAPNTCVVVTTTVSVLPTPVGPSSRKLPRGRAGFVNPSSPRRTADTIRGNAWDWPRISRGRRESNSWSLVSFVGSAVLFIPRFYHGLSANVVLDIHHHFARL